MLNTATLDCFNMIRLLGICKTPNTHLVTCYASLVRTLSCLSLGCAKSKQQWSHNSFESEIISLECKFEIGQITSAALLGMRSETVKETRARSHPEHQRNDTHGNV